jgi:tetratricopeptide (TPR) repeat protein
MGAMSTNSADFTAGVTAPEPAKARPLLDRSGNVYEPAVGPRLKILLALIFVSFAVLSATAAYLVAIRLLNVIRAPLDYTNYFYMWMFLVHVALGAIIAIPFLVFGLSHYSTARHRKNKVAVRLGIALFITGIVVTVSGLALNQFPVLPRIPTGVVRTVILWLHGLAPLLAIVLYVRHRRAGPDIKWSWGFAWGAVVAVFVVFMLFMHSQDPRKWYAQGPREGRQYFFPSEVRTVGGNLIPARALMMDTYCKKCHEDIYNDHLHSAHKFSSFNNPAYLFSVRKTRDMGLERDGHVQASRWCAGCHDIVPFLSGAFDNPNFDDVKDSTAHAGITCVVCHGITHVDSTIGNGAYTIEEPLHYPFAYSEDAVLQWINNQLIKAKPEFHKKTFLKPFHKTAEFCSTCHKVSLPKALNDYKEFTRGQNHYDTYLLSGVSGVGARSFYYPPVAKTNCAECHMPPRDSEDFGSRPLDDTGKRQVHHHRFAGANTGLPWLLSQELEPRTDPEALKKVIEFQEAFLKDKLRIDLFGLKIGQTPEEEGTVKGKLIAPLRPELPELVPGHTYLVEVVIRTVNMGHPFPQGTADSNEIWVDFTASAGGKVLGRSGALKGEKETGEVDKWSHFVNMFLLDEDGNRINRRNPEDIVIPLYDHQIPPGAGQVVHYKLTVPPGIDKPVDLKVKLRYRKFDHDYMRQVYARDSKIPRLRGVDDKAPSPRLPIVDMCEDSVTLPVNGMKDAAKVLAELKKQKSTIPPPMLWQRWNDYGIGCFLEGAPGGNRPEGKKPEGELDQAEKAFARLAYGKEYSKNPVARGNGLANLARVYNDMGQLEKAVKVLKEANDLNRALPDNPPVPWWTVAWVTGQVEARRKHFDEAIKLFEKILDPALQPRQRKFDFTKDYVVRNALGEALFSHSQDKNLSKAERSRLLRRAAEEYEKTLQLDPENPGAHIGLRRCYQLLGTAVPPAGARPRSERDERLLDLARKAFAKLPFLTWKEIRAAKAKSGLEVITSTEKAGISLQDRQAAADELAEELSTFADIRADQDATRFAVILDLVGLCAPVTNYLAIDIKEPDGIKVGKVLRSPETLALQASAKKIVARLQQKAYAILTSQGQTLADGKEADATRLEAAAQLFDMVVGLSRPDAVAEFPKVPLFQAVISSARRAYLGEEDGRLRGATAMILGRIHAALHLIYKIDDEATAIAGKAREKPQYLAAAKAADPVVIYPLSPR